MTPKIVVVGSANTDFVLRVPQLPLKGETVLGGDFRVVRGGKGANQAVAAARLGADVTLVARVGADAFGRESREVYEKEGIHTDFVVEDNAAHSGVALIMVNPNGENMIAVGPGANGHLTAEDVLVAREAIQNTDCVLLQLEIPLDAVQATLQIARAAHAHVILNPAPARHLPREILQLVDYLTPNETEAALLAGIDASVADHDFLSGLPSALRVPHIVVTLGSRGACIVEAAQMTMVPPFPITPVDTTASGDAFSGAFAVALARGDGLVDAVRFANAAGAIAATRLGAQPSLPSRKEIEQFMALSAPGPNPAVPAAGMSK